MGSKWRVIVIDDKYHGIDQFWQLEENESDSPLATVREQFDFEVYPYPAGRLLDEEIDGIDEFLKRESGRANFLLLDMMFPGNDKGGLTILDHFRRLRIDIPVIVVVSSTVDQTVAFDLAGYPFVHRMAELDIERISQRFLKIADEDHIGHPRRGILITHGTDTLAYALEMLRYGIKRLDSTNVILTGSQISMAQDGAASDGVDNVRSATLLLQHLYASELGVVFNRGEDFFRSNIIKLRKWGTEAFGGEVAVKLDWDRFEALASGIRLHKSPPKLEKLSLIRTGGTIESTKDEERGYVPGADVVGSFIQANMANCFIRFENIPFGSLDSSNLTFDDWIQLLRLIESECGIEVDLDFDPGVGVVVPTPFTKSDDYDAWLSRLKGVVIAGYGAGNANMLSGSPYSLLEPVKKHAPRIPIILASQVPYDMTDFAYEVGRAFIDAGCIPAGHLSIPAALVRLSYILGHRDEFNLGSTEAIRRYYARELQFRTEESRMVFQSIIDRAADLAAQTKLQGDAMPPSLA